MPFIQVTCEGTDAPIRHTVSLVGAAAAADEPLLEPHLLSRPRLLQAPRQRRWWLPIW
jgi:hypothetical protein